MNVPRLVSTLAVAALLACTVLPTPVPTPQPTATPKFIMLAPVEVLMYQIAEEHGQDFIYIQYHFVPADTEAWVLFGWPDEDDAIYRAVFRLVGGEWKLIESKPMETPTPTPTPPGTPSPKREARR